MSFFREKIGVLTRSKNIRNSFWIIGEQVFQMFVTLIVGIISARYLGPSNYGALNYTASFVTFISSIAMLGLDGVLIKKLIYSPDDEGVYLGSCIALRFIASGFSMAAVAAIVYFLHPGDHLKIVLVSLQSLQLLFKSVQILDAWFQRYLKSKYISIGKIIACIIVASYKIYLLATFKSIEWFAFSNSLTDIVISIALYAFYKHEQGPRLRVSKKHGLEVLGESYHFIISGLMVSVYTQMDRIMIGKMLTDNDVGLYAAATAICTMWIFVPQAIYNSFRPMIMEIKKSGDEQLYKKRLEQLYSAVIWICIAASAFITLLAPILIYFLYGKDYMGAVSAMRIIIWSETFAMIGVMKGTWIVCENKNKYVKYHLGIGAVTNLIFNSLMIPIWGIKGAAIATLVTQIVSNMVAPALMKETREIAGITIRGFMLSWMFDKKR